MTPTTEAPAQDGVQLTRAHRILIAVVVIGAVIIAAIGFAGSFTAVRDLAEKKGFGDFAPFFPIGIDAGIVVLLGLDMLLAWIRMPFPLLRQTAWLLTAATIAFNGAAAWPDPLGTGMHAVIPILFIVAVEAARHALGRIADITADRHVEPVPLRRWLIDPFGSFIIWRRMGMYGLRSYQDVIDRKRELKVYVTGLKKKCGGGWRWKNNATADELLPLELAPYGVGVQEALAIPARRKEEERKRKQDQKLADQQHANALAEEQARHDEEEADRRRREEERHRNKQLADAEHAEQLAAITRRQQQADGQIQADAWRREQERKQCEVATAERIANAAKERADALKTEREEASQLRILEAQRRAQAATAPPQRPAQSAPGTATATATALTHQPAESATGVATGATQSAPADRHQSATKTATKAPRKQTPKRSEPPTRSAIKDAVEALYATLQKRPTDSEIADELKRIGSPYDSLPFARKIRSEVETSKPHLAELGSDNVRALNQQTKTG